MIYKTTPEIRVKSNGGVFVPLNGDSHFWIARSVNPHGVEPISSDRRLPRQAVAQFIVDMYKRMDIQTDQFICSVFYHYFAGVHFFVDAAKCKNV